MGTVRLNARGKRAMVQDPIQGVVEIFLVASCYGNRSKVRPNGPELARTQCLPTLLLDY